MNDTRAEPAGSGAMRRGRIRVRIITPAVIGGAAGRAGDAIAPLRVPSLRGVWRWWFRTGLGAALWVDGKTSAARDAMLTHMRTLETRLFGSTDRASMLIVRPARRITGNDPVVLELGRGAESNGRRYLGYGLFNRGEHTLALAPGNEYEVSFRLRRDPEGQDAALLAALRATLWAWSTFGGVGARWRRGWGAVELVSAQLDGQPWTFGGSDGGRAEDVAGMLGTTAAGLRQCYTDFGALVRTLRLQPMRGQPHGELRTLAGIARVVPVPGMHADPLAALEHAGVLLQGFRSSLVRGKSRRRPLPDYFEVKAAISREPGAPRGVERAAFGLPLPFYFRSLGGQKATFVPANGADRLASPLLVRVRPIERAGRAAYITTFVNLSERSPADPLLGQGVAMRGRSDVTVPPPDGMIIKQFLDWALMQSPPRGIGGRR